MTTAMRWRVVVLQVGLIGILAFCAGFLFWGNSFIHNQISTELTSQQIYFPASDSKAITSLPAGDAAATAPERLVIPLQPLAPGTYVLRYRVLAADGHLTEGALRFTVGASP